MGTSEANELRSLALHSMHGEMCHKLAILLQKVMDVFPALEALQPLKSDMQALCQLHWAVHRAKVFLKQIVSSSILYLAITSEAVVSNFEKSRESLDVCLRRLEKIAPECLAEQIAVILTVLQMVSFRYDPVVQEAGNELISLLHNEKEIPGSNLSTDMDVFGQIVIKLGMDSAQAILSEKKALRRLLHKTRKADDKKKELIVLYLLHLLCRYMKQNNIEGMLETPALSSPTESRRDSEAGSSGKDSDCSSEICCYEIYQMNDSGEKINGFVHAPPEEFRCPISLQLMSDPVIIASGQTYDRSSIEQWFREGRDTCPKTQQKLAHLDVTPNYCVKALIMSWRERHVLSPCPPPPSPVKSLNRSTPLDSGLWRCNTVPRVDIIGRDSGLMKPSRQAMSDSMKLSIQSCAGVLNSTDLAELCKAAEEIRFLTKHDPDARVQVGALGLIPALVRFMDAATTAENESCLETACLALLNVAISNDRNKAEVIEAGAMPLLLNILQSEMSLAVREAAIAVLLTTSCLDSNKPCIGSSGAVPFLVNHLGSGSAQGMKDALTSLYNLSLFSGNHTCIIQNSAVPKLFHLLSLGDDDFTEKCVSILYNLSSVKEARVAIVEGDISYLSTLADILENGTNKVRELVAGIFLAICTDNAKHSQLVVKEGVVPSLVMLTVDGSAVGKDRALKLLQHFREERQKEPDCIFSCQAPCVNDGKKDLQLNYKDKGHHFKRRTWSSLSFAVFRRSLSLSFHDR